MKIFKDALLDNELETSKGTKYWKASDLVDYYDYKPGSAVYDDIVNSAKSFFRYCVDRNRDNIYIKNRINTIDINHHFVPKQNVYRDNCFEDYELSKFGAICIIISLLSKNNNSVNDLKYSIVESATEPGEYHPYIELLKGLY